MFDCPAVSAACDSTTLPSPEVIIALWPIGKLRTDLMKSCPIAWTPIFTSPNRTITYFFPLWAHAVELSATMLVPALPRNVQQPP